MKYLIEERNFAVKKGKSLFITAFTHGNYLAMQYLIDHKGPFKRIDRVVRIRRYDHLQGLYLVGYSLIIQRVQNMTPTW